MTTFPVALGPGTGFLPKCVCHDPEVNTVAAMVAAGWDQWQASRVVFSTPADDAPREHWSAWVRRHVADVFAPLRQAVGLP